MKEKIEQLAKEKFEYQMPKLYIVPEKLVISVAEGESFCGQIRLFNSAGRRMKGVVYTDSLFLVLEKEQFVGEEAQIPFAFHAEYAKAGEHLEGKLVFVTDAGEEALPYEVQVGCPSLMAGGESIRDLFQFASLAKADWEAAETLFFDGDFARVLFSHDRHYQLLHQVLAATGKRGQAMEEFLVATGKKTPVALHFEKTQFQYEAGSYDFKDTLTLCKSGWGYVEGEIVCEAPFVHLARTHFRENDFVGGKLAVDFVVDRTGAAPGRREAEIRVITNRQELCALLICAVPHRKMEQHRQNQSAKRALCELWRTWLGISRGAGNARHCMEALKTPLDVLYAMEQTAGGDYTVRLARIYLWQMAGKDSLARDALVLLREADLSGDDRQFGFYCYLMAAQKKELLSAQEAAARIRRLCQKHPKDALLFWCFILLDEDYQEKAARFEAIREFCLEYGYSVLLISEAVRLLETDASLLRELGAFELHVLKLAVSCGGINGELTRRLAYLAAREKELSSFLYYILERVCEDKKDDELLGAFCTLLIRSGRRKERDYIWFKRAVERQLKLAELEEFYMYCRREEETEPVPASIFLYFSRGCRLSERKKAVLYADLIKNRREHAQLYQRYQHSIEVFAAEQLKCAAISTALAVIYNEVYREQMQGEELLALPRVVFTHQLLCKRNGKPAMVQEPENVWQSTGMGEEHFVRAVIYHPGKEAPQSVPLVRGEAQIPVWTSDAEIFLVDKAGRYYPAGNLKGEKEGEFGVLIKPFVSLKQHLWECYEAGASDLSLLLHLKEQENKYLKYGSQPQELSRLLAEHREVSQKLREDCIRFLMEYYYENYESELFEYYLKQIRLEGFSQKERARIIHFFIQRGFDERAVQALKKFGTQEVEAKRLNKLALRCLEGMPEEAPEPFLLHLAYHIFECGRCERELLSYLCRFYHGSTGAMYALWKEARAQELDTESLEESLLGQMLFAQSEVGNAQGVFLSYYRYGTNQKLIRAFLNFYAYKFLLNDRMILPELFERMEQEVSLEENEICTLALLGHYAQEESLTQRQKDFLEYKLSGILKKGIVLPFFKKFEDFVRLPEEMYDKTFVEYHTDPSHRVTLHYRIGETQPFSKCVMKNVCHGIFTAGFVLFGEESMQYYITEEYDGQTVITQSTAAVYADEAEHDGKSRYDILNLILAAHAMKDDKTVMKLLENYIWTEYEAEHLFHIRTQGR